MSAENIQQVNKSELAIIMGVSRVTLNDWIARGLPVEKRGSRKKNSHGWRFHLPTVIEWLRQQSADDVKRKYQQHPNAMDIEEARRIEAVSKAELIQIDLAERRQEVVPVESVGKLCDNMVVKCKQRLRGIPARISVFLADETNEKVIAKLLGEEIDDALRVISDGIKFDDLYEE